jgi:transcriptional regulator
MYSPQALKMDSLTQQQQFIQKFAFGVMVSSDLQGTHIPFILDSTSNENETVLYSHLALANPHWKTLNKQKVVIIFNGPHAYISPRYYEKSPNVPTWNYAAVHVYGEIELLDNEQTISVLTNTLKTFEPSLLEDKSIVSDEYRDKLTKAIIGFKVTVTSIEGKLKLAQNRSTADQIGIISALETSKRHSDLEYVEYVKSLV